MKIKGIYIVGLVIILFMMTAMPIISNTMTIGIEANDETKRETITLLHTGKTDGIYHTYDEMEELLIELEKEHPDIFHLSSMGKTYQGRDIWMLKISDNVGIDEDEPEVLLMGAHHGNEKPSFEILIFFIEHIANNYGKELTDDDGDGYINEDPIDGVDNDNDGLIDEDPSEERARDVVNNTEIYIVPMVNPDGVEANTRKNQAPNYGLLGFFPIITSYGVDLNRNYDYKWFRWFLKPWKYWRYTSQFNTKSSIYRGEKPFCENETIAVRELVNQHGFILSISYHTYGELILYPWGYTKISPPDKDLFVSIGNNISNINHYKVTQGINLYPTIGTSDDWFYGEKGVLAYTIELGKSYAPDDPDVLLDLCKTHVGVNLHVAEIARGL